MVSVELIGDQELFKMLRDLAKCLPNEKVEPLMMEGAKVVAAAAKAKAPVVTGNLKKGIKAKLLKPISGKPRSAAAVSNAPHAYLVEYGSGPRTQKNGRYTGRMPANPYFRPAVDAHYRSVTESTVSKLWQMIIGACK
jgi:HK97 gp10 family phage protein